MRVYTLTSQPFLDQHNECYKNIITVNQKPEGPLADITRSLHAPKLSPFKENSPCCPQNNCIYGITKIDNPLELMCFGTFDPVFGYGHRPLELKLFCYETNTRREVLFGRGSLPKFFGGQKRSMD